METLGNILGVPPSSLNSSIDNALQDSDPFEDFIKETQRTKELTPDGNLLDELEKLQSKHDKLEVTLKNVIPPLHDYMVDFNTRLSEYTRDLGYIRNKSSELKELLEYNSTKLANVSPLVNDLIVPPSIVNEIISGKINSDWQENIAFMRDKMMIYEKYKVENNESQLNVPKDFDALYKILEDLRTIILERSKKYIIHAIKALRNYHPVPSQKIQKGLLEVKDIFQYIVENNYSLALELRQAYSYTMRWYYKNYFSRYIRSLTILQFRNIDAQYFLGNGLSNTSVNYLNGYSITNYLTASYSKGAGYTTDESIQEYFQVDKRLSVLTQEDNTVMVSQIAENNTMETYVEIGFRNLNLALLDNCVVESKFLSDFFRVSDNTEEVAGILEQIFQPTLDEVLEYTKQLIFYTYDIFGILLSIRIAQQLQLEAENNGINIISDFMTSQLMLLWPKFQQLVDFQCDNLKKVVITTNVAKLTNVSSNNDPLTTPHELTVQFSKLLCSFLTVAITHTEGIDERSEPLYNSIIRIRKEFEAVLGKCSKKTKSPERFLATNYMYLYNVLQQQRLKLEGSDNTNLPILIEETENHYAQLVHSFNTMK
ncbi:hypothetical protein Kpol_1053p33 [Vanderwaltozyma polyspora DSM 70294]|uniref:Vacuolar protein sorting-associated protein 52 n=1 Tax=Vanderwaltozyma polyspora (strain ATCC 22028 / DSM 70294 / BCRC 21397 / CBS 2163 / NBRC 10782 / NRRL Y-8283 / UCD 57-17) TaxID=436907 RepID=A7TN78_VANPO|nr:uncharacterized protein Kpol_1053p33 [Vanderwaltozyma polyspora DSM 70294]EDO16296.1 hypothetical protein Kpol_1053p33 [Vanderwaltozyma polyspora DSM 70294]